MRAASKAADIANQVTLGEATVKKFEASKDNNKRVEAVGKLTKSRMAAILVMYRNNFRLQTAKETLRLDCTVALNASGFYSQTLLIVVLPYRS